MEPVESTPRSPMRRLPSRLLMFVVCANVCLLSGVVWVYACFGSVGAAFDYYRGKFIHVWSTEASFFDAAPGQDVRVSYIIENRGSKPIRIIGCGMGCAGRPATDLPLVLKPGKPSRLEIDVRVFAPRPKAGRSLKMPVAVYTDDPNQPQLALSINWTVKDSDHGKDATD